MTEHSPRSEQRGSPTPLVRLACLVTALVLLDAPGVVQARDEDGEQSTKSSAGDLQVEIVDHFVSLQARDVPIRVLLEAIAGRGRLSMMLHDPLDERISMELDRRPLPEVIRQILRHHSFTLHYVGQPGEGYGRLWVFSEGEENNQGSVELGSTAADEQTAGRLQDLSALTEAGNDAAAAALAVDALTDADASVREEAVYLLSEPGEGGIQLLQQALSDPEPEVRKAAIDALADIGGESAARALTVTLNDAEVSLRMAAVDALGDIDAPTAHALLRQALANPQPAVRRAAADYLAE